MKSSWKADDFITAYNNTDQPRKGKHLLKSSVRLSLKAAQKTDFM